MPDGEGLTLASGTAPYASYVTANPRATLTCDPRTFRRAPLSDIPDFSRSESVMKIVNSLKSLKDRHRDNRVIRRRGRIYVINKTQKRFKARQG